MIVDSVGEVPSVNQKVVNLWFSLLRLLSIFFHKERQLYICDLNTTLRKRIFPRIGSTIEEVVYENEARMILKNLYPNGVFESWVFSV